MDLINGYPQGPFSVHLILQISRSHAPEIIESAMGSAIRSPVLTNCYVFVFKSLIICCIALRALAAASAFALF